MTSNEVTIDIGKYPRSKGVETDNKIGYYYQSGGKVLLEETYYPEPDGTYMKLTHTPEHANIQSITHNDIIQTVSSDLSEFKSVAVFYWSGDSIFGNPLLIQLGNDDNEYYNSTPERLTYWDKLTLTAINLKSELDKQNCERNKVHIVKISEKGNTNNTYQCPSCSKEDIQTHYNNSHPGSSYYIHSIPGSSAQISGFRDNEANQVGLPSIKNLKFVFVYWNKPAAKPVLIHYPQSPPRCFRRNSDNDDTWVEVSRYQEQLLNDKEYYPSITIDLMSANVPYTDNSVIVTVRNTIVEGGYSKFEHSLRGGLVMIAQAKHSSNVLNDILSNDKLDSITAYYSGDDPGRKEKLLLVELRSSGGTKYEYFHRETKSAPTWSKYSGSGGETKLSNLKETLDKLKKVQFPSGKSTLRKALEGCGETGAAGGVVAEAYNFFFNPNKSATRQIIRLFTRIL
ncbi:hypothetical protein BEWA_050460 [Theileria equi strain WA]|uniref:Uncharacterized protein n=1 Tax=Theileria equi strain WA TaxID=1537102 RepID=L1LBM5_THEEQ|nr:hypothetical protein BEWA_050460 [Theileria equi strain WA]EKX72578.1 hypothetical protein BEWA_050460 [Theileria equi strain WA]|eukprot:XP_004832030.1 hypothetical protein BEWA_050460 [Theileria equi strain WA]